MHVMFFSNIWRISDILFYNKKGQTLVLYWIFTGFIKIYTPGKEGVGESKMQFGHDYFNKVVTLLEACHVTGALTNQRRVLVPTSRRASAICPANDTSGATYLMRSHVSSALWTT